MALDARFKQSSLKLNLIISIAAIFGGIVLFILVNDRLGDNDFASGALRGGMIGGVIGGAFALAGAVMGLKQGDKPVLSINDNGVHLHVAGFPAYNWPQIRKAEIEAKLFGKQLMLYVDKPAPSYERLAGTLLGLTCRAKGEEVRISIPLARLDQSADAIDAALKAHQSHQPATA